MGEMGISAVLDFIESHLTSQVLKTNSAWALKANPRPQKPTSQHSKLRSALFTLPKSQESQNQLRSLMLTFYVRRGKWNLRFGRRRVGKRQQDQKDNLVLLLLLLCLPRLLQICN